jgi:hypothetical protein
VTGGFGGQALGGPFDVFVGGDVVTLTFTGSTLRAFGADFYYAPAFEALPAGLYQIRVDDGSGTGTLVGNIDGLDSGGGSFFLGILADAGSQFGTVSLLSLVPSDASGEPYLVPAYQVDNLVYEPASVVAEPSSLSLVIIGSVTLLAKWRRLRVRASSRPTS